MENRKVNSSTKGFQTNIRRQCIEAGKSLIATRGNPNQRDISFPFNWGDCWHFATELLVDDFVAEVGFFVDVLGFKLNALDAGYAMFMAPSEDVFIAVKQVDIEKAGLAHGNVRLCLMLDNILSAVKILEGRGVVFDILPLTVGDSSMHHAALYTPNGVQIELWGFDNPPIG